MKTILITGASSGIGKASAETFADNGWNVVATMRTPEAGADLAQRENILVVPLDVERPETIEAAIEAGIARFGGIDTLLNNAGISFPGVFEQTPAESVLKIFRVNVFGVMDVTRAILPHFRERKGGVIVTVGSSAGVVGLPLNSLYSATKFAIDGFCESLSFELLAQNIVVKLIEPGLVKTNMASGWLDSLTSNNSIPDYEAYTTAIRALYGGLVAGEMPEAAEAAQDIFEAATDGTDRLRYVITASGKQLVDMRRNLPEEEYINTLRSTFSV